MKNTEIWIGRFDVRPRPGNDVLGSAKGAIVNVVGLASDEGGFVKLVEDALNTYGLQIIRCDDIARLDDWKTNNRLHRDLRRLIDGLTSEYPIQFDEFQSYVSDDA